MILIILCISHIMVDIQSAIWPLKNSWKSLFTCFQHFLQHFLCILTWLTNFTEGTQGKWKKYKYLICIKDFLSKCRKKNDLLPALTRGWNARSDSSAITEFHMTFQNNTPLCNGCDSLVTNRSIHIKSIALQNDTANDNYILALLVVPDTPAPGW